MRKDGNQALSPTRPIAGLVREVHMGLDAVVPLPEIGCDLPLAEVYDGVDQVQPGTSLRSVAVLRAHGWFRARTWRNQRVRATMPRMGDHPILFLPGPTEVEAELRAVMATPLVGHRSAGFVAEVKAVCQKLKDVYRTRAHAVFETCPATALMEATIRNLVPRGGRTLHLVCGAFSERWLKIAKDCGRRPEALTVPWGQAHDPATLRKTLQAGRFDAVAITHNETSTGVLEPLHELAAVVRETAKDTLVMADVVTALAGAPLHFDEFGLDAAFAGTQKCLALPPGLCTYALSDRALQRAATVEERGYLLDFVRAVPDTEAGKTLATPCVPLVSALHRQLDRVLKEGLEARWARHAAMREATMAWAAQHEIAPYVASAASRSPTVSCLWASGRDVDGMAKRATAAGYKIDQGYGDLKGKTFRIGHMGDHPVERVRACLATLLG
jgi:aspartate aminotransferase-like enzyme